MARRVEGEQVNKIQFYEYIYILYVHLYIPNRNRKWNKFCILWRLQGKNLNCIKHQNINEGEFVTVLNLKEIHATQCHLLETIGFLCLRS